MTFKTSHLIILGIIGVALLNGENVRSTIDKGNQIRQERSEFSDRIRKNRDDARNAEKLSKVALDRYRANCIRVVDTQTQREGYFQEGGTITDDTLRRPLRDGAAVCNSMGDTAVVQDGRIADIARVSTDDIPEMQRILLQQR